jgi:hypothetical protein
MLPSYDPDWQGLAMTRMGRAILLYAVFAIVFAVVIAWLASFLWAMM